MKRSHILILAMVIVVALAVTSLIPNALQGIPKNTATIYITMVQIAALLLGFFLALKVAAMYQKELRYTFLFLALFLLIYTFACPLIFWQWLTTTLGSHTVIYLLLALQAINYVMLITSCVYTVKAIQVKKMNAYGWAVLGIMAAFALYIIIRSFIFFSGFISGDPLYAISGMFIRVFDMAVVLMLVPVFVLYVQHIRAKNQESITFTMIITGIVITFLSTYVTEIITGVPIIEIASKYYQTGSWLDVINIFGYLLIAVGLYAHMKYDEWGFRMIEKSLG